MWRPVQICGMENEITELQRRGRFAINNYIDFVSCPKLSYDFSLSIQSSLLTLWGTFHHSVLVNRESDKLQQQQKRDPKSEILECSLKA